MFPLEWCGSKRCPAESPPKRSPATTQGLGTAQADSEPVPGTLEISHRSAAFPGAACAGSDHHGRWVVTGPWLSQCARFTHTTTGHKAVRSHEIRASLLMLPFPWVSCSITAPFPPQVPPTLLIAAESLCAVQSVAPGFCSACRSPPRSSTASCTVPWALQPVLSERGPHMSQHLLADSVHQMLVSPWALRLQRQLADSARRNHSSLFRKMKLTAGLFCQVICC